MARDPERKLKKKKKIKNISTVQEPKALPAAKRSKAMPPAENHKRVTSITRELHHHQIWKSTWGYLRADLFLVLVCTLIWLIAQEVITFGGINWDYDRSFSIDGTVLDLVYKVTDLNTEKVLMESHMGYFLRVLFIAAGILFAVQFLWVWITYFHEDRKIRRILNPLDQLALRADELSRTIAFTEDKYQTLEHAIDQIQPGDGEGDLLSFGDSDLAGVEAAMNNLLLRMRETYRQQSRFVNDASHELRTPIAVIQGYVNMLERWGKEDESILEESITAIRNEADHMNHLVEQLLFLARGDSGRTELHLETTNLNDLMNEIYEESFMIDESHPYRFSPYEVPLYAEIDPGLFKQSVRILVDNAAKYTNKGDEILLSCGKTDEGNYYVQVQDTGIGMEEADVKHMFERFYRSDDVRSYAGTGLGLSIAKWIVDKHRGHFEILSRPGLGTRLRIILE